jgi:ERCC4-type nuclease
LPADAYAGSVAVVVCDVHERRSSVPDRLGALGCGVEWAALATGDYAIGRAVLVERMTVSQVHGPSRSVNPL